MGFINKIIGFFRKKEESAEKIDRIVGLANQEKPVESAENNEISKVENEAVEDKQEVVKESIEESVENEKEIPEEEHGVVEEYVEEETAVSDHTPKEKIIVPSTKGNVNFVNIDVNKLELIRVEREAETITAYSKLLVKNIAHFKDTKEQADVEGIVKKFKMIFVHSMELKNLLSYMNECFFEYILANLTDEQIRKEVEEGKKKTDEIEGLLGKIGSYDDLINPEKSSDYKKNIEEIVHKGEFTKELEKIGKLLMDNINDKKTGIGMNINKAVAKLAEMKK